VIKFSLICDQGHDFEAWFRDSGDFETQNRRGFPGMPFLRLQPCFKGADGAECRHRAQARRGGRGDRQCRQREVMAKLQEMAREMKKTGEDVGERFPEEARKIHYGEADPRGIYGKATPDEVSGLLDEGVEILPLPDLPEDLN
jgi:hypothetical protein